ncbi:Fibronectin type III domain protein [Niveomyces insectorum RCEF 264]|uniref:Fibronectin type III domain protein n=1 Tax=Niveomyces insectorum RCEF 264 TaxID=1081102 RepID=A0A167UW38_9HYPO|nr:Fibronectin type III domain protein [Niveomyces insectorum RCEF 264]
MARAIPSSPPPLIPRNESSSGNDTNSTTGPLGGTLITDPARLAFFESLHDQALAFQNNGSAVPVPIPVDPAGNGDLTERDPIEAAFLAGVYAVLLILGGDIDSVLQQIANLFLGSTLEWWDQTSRCRTHFKTHGGGEEDISIYAKGHKSPTSENKQNIGWNNPASTAPPVLYFDDADIGPYSVQFTATDTVAWSGIPNTEKCYILGLCNPQYIFYHKGYNIILNTWESQGDVTSCQYSKGHDCKGLCLSGVENQFSKGGVVWGGYCAIPCYDDLSDLPSVAKPAPKVMVVGDSISHGMQDDWTWRYRLWSWLDFLGYQPTFVGPYQHTHGMPGLESSEPAAPTLPGEEALNFVVDGGYADGVADAFKASGHYAFWGRQALQDVNDIEEYVRQFQPDYVLMLLGFNDLGWFVSGPDGLIGNVGDLVERAREGRADVKLLIGNVVQRLFIDGREDLVDNTLDYNNKLKNTLPNWFRWESPIAYVDVAGNYDCRPESCPDGYDGLHPAAMGEHHIAQAFADMLQSGFGFAGNPYSVPASADGRPVDTPTDVRSYAYPEGILTTWNPMHNARGYEIRSRITGMTDWWSSGIVYPTTWGSWLSWVLDGQTWERQVRTVGNFDERSDWTALTSATAHPQTAPGPSNIGVMPIDSDGVSVTWSPVTGYDVNRYGLLLWDRDTPGAFLSAYATTGTSVAVHGLQTGHRYGVWVCSYINMAKGSVTNFPATPGGLPAPANDIIVGGGVPPPPASLSVQDLDATSIMLSWPAVANAAGYTIYMRSLTGSGFQSVGQTTDTSQGIGFLFPGVWTYEFCIGSYNGGLESSYGNACVTPPRCCGYKRDEQAVNTTVYRGDGTVANVTLINPNDVPINTTNKSINFTDPDIGKLYYLYSQAMSLLDSNHSALAAVPPDTVVQLF